MKLDNRHSSVKIDVPMSDLSTVNFSQGLLEQIMIIAGTTEVRSGRIREDLYTIGVGELRFQGKDSEEAFRKLLFWLLTNHSSLSAEEYAEEAKHTLDMEDADSKLLIEELTKDGMSDFGMKVQEYRFERGAKIAVALSEIEKDLGRIPMSINTLQDELEGRTGYSDLDLQEILTSTVDYQKMKEFVDPTLIN